MQRVLSTHLFVNHRLTAVWLDRVQDAAFDAVEIFCGRQHLDYRNREQVVELQHWFKDSGLKLWSLHAPMYTDDVWGRTGPQAVVNIAVPNKAKRIAMVDEIKRALEVADLIPFRYLIQHIGVRGEEYDEAKAEAAFNSLEELKVFARQRNVEILIENTPNAFSNAEKLNYFLGTTHLNLNYCFDVGHAHMGRGITPEWEAMQERIRSTHLHDNDGVDDQHLFPLEGKGSIDWSATMKVLAARAGQYPLVLELREQQGLELPVQRARELMDALEKMI